MMEWTVARPSLTMNKNLLLGNNCLRYWPDSSVKGSLLQSRTAGSPCLAMTSRMNDDMADARTSSVRPASSKARDQKQNYRLKETMSLSGAGGLKYVMKSLSMYLSLTFLADLYQNCLFHIGGGGPKAQRDNVSFKR